MNNELRMQYKIDLLARLRIHYETLEAKRNQQMNTIQREFPIGSLIMVYWPVPKKGCTQKLLPMWKEPLIKILIIESNNQSDEFMLLNAKPSVVVKDAKQVTKRVTVAVGDIKM
ncbi:hypothetical protein BpHYR1_049616 [Brachionus plicatilis]|uniref:Uncharacterized protein n=1 Tax=Brachionus plicatilis TaxID=10195 RepID=A0A3M7RN01_BRAPC|nr:hypothetical protein BpHYR1_049616 [Brachionus plicatilis]